ncbi:imidazole glycerol phosphate synthase subunit HisH [Candidatus Pelagibacter bacterium]|nr:imidazole glycerol phosphate synthase subunit HisH [Candidatus Pelagibacter bacterium]
MIGLLDLGIGNLFSISNLFSKISKKKITIISEPNFLSENINEITHLVIPGVGSYPSAMETIEKSNWKKNIIKFKETNKPLLGICLGMQLFFNESEENGVITKGLGLLDGSVIKMIPKESFKLPHIGWNNLKLKKNDPILNGLNLDVDFYFLHSYKCLPTNDDILICTTDYSEMFPSIIRKENIIGFQFHPEKSSQIGQKLIENFLNL